MQETYRGTFSNSDAISYNVQTMMFELGNFEEKKHKCIPHTVT